MEQAPGYEEPGDKVYKLLKALYGLKQAPRQWNAALVKTLLADGWVQSKADPCVFLLRKGDAMAILVVYVDDLIIAANKDEILLFIKGRLMARFEMKDIGELCYVLGMTIEIDAEKLRLHQKSYLIRVLERFGMADCKPVSTPEDPNVKLSKSCPDNGADVDRGLYQSMVGALLYSATISRPDLAHSVSSVARFSAEPKQMHFSALKRILRYIRGTLDLAIEYSATGNERIIGYSDADFANDEDDRKSTTGLVFTLAGGAISWLSRKQDIVSLSTMESEYIALCTATQESTYLRQLQIDLEIPGAKDPIQMNCDNRAAIALATNPMTTKRSKHIDVKYHYVREKEEKKEIEVKWCQTEEMAADMFTKAIPKPQFQKLCGSIGLKFLLQQALLLAVFLVIVPVLGMKQNTESQHPTSFLFSNISENQMTFTAKYPPINAAAMSKTKVTKIATNTSRQSSHAENGLITIPRGIGTIRVDSIKGVPELFAEMSMASSPFPDIAVNNKQLSRAKREVNCDSTSSRKVLQFCAVQKVQELVKDELETILLVNAATEDFINEFNLDIKALKQISTIFKLIPGANKTIINYLDKTIDQLTEANNKTQSLLELLTTTFNKVKKDSSDGILIPLVAANNILVLPSFVLSIVSLSIHLLMFIKYFRCVFKQSGARGNDQPLPLMRQTSYRDTATS